VHVRDVMVAGTLRWECRGVGQADAVSGLVRAR